MCLKKYIIEDFKAGLESEKALVKAQELLLFYAGVVYTEE